MREPSYSINQRNVFIAAYPCLELWEALLVYNCMDGNVQKFLGLKFNVCGEDTNQIDQKIHRLKDS